MGKHLILGGVGGCGWSLARSLAADGERVAVLDRRLPARPVFGIEARQGSVEDRQALEAAFEDVEYLHFALVQATAGARRDDLERVNVGGLRAALELAARRAVRKVVVISSSLVYGEPAELPVTEATPRRPAGLYGRLRLEAERVIERAVGAGQAVVVLRPHIVVGPGLAGLFETLFVGLRSGKIRLATSLRWPHDMVHVDDLVAAWRSALAWPGSASFNLGCGPSHSIRDLMEGLIEERGLGAAIRQTPRVWSLLRRRCEHWTGRCWLGPSELVLLRRGLVFDCAAAEEALGWRPYWSAGEMVREAYDFSLRAGGR